MIYTVTCNPALDYVMRLTSFSEGATNRSVGETLSVGGKGINVSMVLARLGLPTCALGFVAGFTGDAIESGLAAEGIATDFVHLPAGSTRINVKMKRALSERAADAFDAAGDILETEINGRGPEVDEASLAALVEKIAHFDPDDTLVLSGSSYAGASDSLYFDLASAATERGVRTVIDATGALLMNSLPAHPFLIKPNNEELAAIAGCDAHDTEALIEAAGILVDRGARYVLVSCGGDGAFLVDENGLVGQQPAKKGSLVNSVGAGDSMVAGFIAGYEGALAAEGAQPHDPLHALALGTAAGSATAFSVGLAARDDIEKLLAS